MARRNHICFTKCLNSIVTIYPKTLGKTIAQECKKTTLLAHVHRSKNDAIIQCISKSPEQTTKSRKIASPRITAHVFWSFPNGMTQIIWFSKKNFRISRVNGTYLVSNALRASVYLYFCLPMPHCVRPQHRPRPCSLRYSSWRRPLLFSVSRIQHGTGHPTYRLPALFCWV